jgi:hypothetical protein
MMASTRIGNFLENNPWYQIDAIFLFQTDWMRDNWMFVDHDQDSFHSFAQAESYFISQFYYSLSEISVNYRVPIYLIGGLSDALCLDRFELEYPGLQIACHSFVNLLINDIPIPTQPTFSICDKHINPLIDLLPKNAIVKKEVLDKFDLAKHRENTMIQNPLLFPDRQHPSATAHAVLYRFLRSEHNSVFK